MSDVLKANLLACIAEGIVGKIFNIDRGKRYALFQLVDTINKILGKSIKPIFEKERIGDVKHSLADIEKAKKS